MARITFTAKVDRRTQNVPDENRVTAADMNMIKSSVNALYDLMDTIRKPIIKTLTSASFSGSNYQDSDLVGMTGYFDLFTNDGSGVLLKLNDGYTYNATTGTITTDAGNYILKIYKPVVE